MILMAIVMFGSIPLILMLFTAVPPRRAVVLSFIGCWLFLPPAGFPIPGLPDYTKLSAPPAIILLGILINDPTRLFGLRPRWFDLPAIVLCACPFVASLTNDLGVYDAFSNTLGQILCWGIPYLIGRCYFTTLDGLRDLAVGVVVGGLLYTPLCLWEIRMSPNLNLMLYGFSIWEPMRWSGFRPKVFMSTGLEVGMWMVACTLVGFALWSSGTLKRFRDYPIAPLLVVLFLTTVFCKATGALILLAAGVAALATVRFLKTPIPLLVLSALPIGYVATRATGAWDGHQAVDLAVSYISEDRAQSLKFRLDNENILIEKALQRPVFGWSGWGRARVYDEKGRDISVTDGFWIITLGTYGLVGLGAMTATLLLPGLLLVGRYPAARWSHPRVQPAAVLAVLLALWMIDNLSNAMFNPLYVMMAGGLIGLKSERVGAPGETRRKDRTQSPASSAALDDPLWLLDRRRERAGRLSDAGQHEEAESLLNENLHDLQGLVDVHPDVTRFRLKLAETAVALGRSRIVAGSSRDAIGPWLRAVEAYKGAADLDPENPTVRHRRLAHLNDFAWLLATETDPTVHDPIQAVAWAEAAAEGEPENPGFWNTLGASYLAADRVAEAVAALEAAIRLGGGTGFDFFYLAMAHARTGQTRAARHALDRALDWMIAHDPDHPHLLRLRREATSLLNLPVLRRDVGDATRS